MLVALQSEWKNSHLCLTTVEEISVFDGWIDNSGHVLRAKREFLNKPTAKRKTHIINNCFIQTFTET
jgi:hypothetical protein